jgi:hypothetical protein
MTPETEEAAIDAAFESLIADHEAGISVTGEADDIYRFDGWINVRRLVQKINEVLDR